MDTESGGHSYLIQKEKVGLDTRHGSFQLKKLINQSYLLIHLKCADVFEAYIKEANVMQTSPSHSITIIVTFCFKNKKVLLFH